jgi:hypothetical protein
LLLLLPVVARQAGFNHDYGCVHKDVPEYEHLIRVLPRCFTEVMLRVANPLRPIFPNWFKGGDKGAQQLAALQCAAKCMLRIHSKCIASAAIGICSTTGSRAATRVAAAGSVAVCSQVHATHPQQVHCLSSHRHMLHNWFKGGDKGAQQQPVHDNVCSMQCV